MAKPQNIVVTLTAEVLEDSAFDPSQSPEGAAVGNLERLIRSMLHDRHEQKMQIMSKPDDPLYDYLIVCIDHDIEMANRLLKDIKIEVVDDCLLTREKG